MKTESWYGAIPRDLVGDNAPSVRSGDDAALYGSAVFEPLEPVEARTHQSFVLRYTAGKIGLDDTGGIQVCTRMVSDAGKPQTTDPTKAGYLTATCSGEGSVRLTIGPYGQRPWNLAIKAELRGGYLSEGDTITIVFGDTSQGSPGMLMQTFAEGSYEFRVSTDVQATGNYLPLEQQFSLPIVAGGAAVWKAVLPSLRRPGEPFHLGLKAEDAWGNPTNHASGRVMLVPSLKVSGLDLEFPYEPDDRAMCFENLTVEEEGTLTIRVLVGGAEVAEAGPLVIKAGDVAGFWGDLHGQTGETVGVNSIESYFDFARNKAFLDVSAHQGNDFQINTKFWGRLNEVTAEADEPGRFTAFPGYEWSGNTAIGGDHNVFFRNEGRQIRRCSHALLEDRSEMGTDAHTLTDLYAALADEDCVIYAHVGGRYANIHYDHDAKLETAVEVHSAWGTFEWILTDGFPLGRRVGIVANSDGHKGRPGASYPGASTFGAYGGLTCFLTDKNDRDSIFEAQRRRHHYATTGCRMYMDVSVAIPGGGTLFERNPDAVPNTPTHAADTAIMGDIVQTDAGEVELSLNIQAHAGIERIEVRNGTEVLKVLRPYDETDLGERVRVLWRGAEYRGRGRDTSWRGRAAFSDAAITGFDIINRWNPEHQLEQRGINSVLFDTITTGNFMGFDAWLDSNDGTLDITTNRGDLSLKLSDIGFEDTVLEAGGLERELAVFRLPEEPLSRELSATVPVKLGETGDNPVWICVTTEDGYQAWSSPVYLFR
ncbi:MAG: DUF3604 domain-containing protein [Alphaproteobacteria bacterium]|nr:DUF3604 domain-containing protein [Alphaproteobacteria bacterium]